MNCNLWNMSNLVTFILIVLFYSSFSLIYGVINFLVAHYFIKKNQMNEKNAETVQIWFHICEHLFLHFTKVKSTFYKHFHINTHTTCIFSFYSTFIEKYMDFILFFAQHIHTYKKYITNVNVKKN